MTFRSLEWIDDEDALRLLDQRKLPIEVTYLTLSNEHEIASAIATMTIRGAPAIGVAAAYGIVAAARAYQGSDVEELRDRLASADLLLRSSRPTAVNLFWALNHMQRVLRDQTSAADIRTSLLDEARRIEADDIAVNRAISSHALAIVPQHATFFHHCNTGALATVDLGTALGIIRTAHESGREVFAFLDETRPRLQGSKLSAWELNELGIPHAVVVDGASAHVMRTRKVDLCVVGCDRVAANGDTANKIGTYNLALAAQDNGVPFYVAAPSSTIDLSIPNGDAIEIEERGPHEITHSDGVQLTADGIGVFNPAFDVTPARLIAGIITEFGIARAPFAESLQALMGKKTS